MLAPSSAQRTITTTHPRSSGRRAWPDSVPATGLPLMRGHPSRRPTPPSGYSGTTSRWQYAGMATVASAVSAGQAVAHNRSLLLRPGQSAFRHDNTLYSEGHQVRSYEVDKNRRASLSTIARLLQETASNHALRVGVVSEDGFCMDENMSVTNLIWVLSRMRLKITEFPVWGQPLEIDTWFQVHSKIAARRDWHVKRSSVNPAEDGASEGRSADEGECLVTASSLAVLVNAETRKLARIPRNIIELYDSYVPKPAKWALGEGEGTKKNVGVQSFLDAAVACSVVDLRVRHGDIDMNNHVNNAVYIEWTLEAIPEEIWEKALLTEVDLEWCAEADPKLPIRSETCVDPNVDSADIIGFVHKLVSGGTVCFRAQTIWTYTT